MTALMEAVALPGPSVLARASRRVEAVLGAACEALAAALVGVEVLILLAGVVARYVFNRPLVWSDELASMLFLWLAMLGAVIALRRQEHMRMTAVVAALRPGARAGLEVFGTGASLLFLAAMLGPALEFAADEMFITTPALEVTNAWRAYALPCGIGLMTAFAVLRLVRYPVRAV